MLKRNFLYLVLMFGLVAASGCGVSRVKVVGKLTRSGQPLPGRVLMVFIPFAEGGTPPGTYSANVKADGAYEVRGSGGKGIPPGKYRIALTVLDRPKELKTSFGHKDSPIMRTVTAESSTQTIDIDIDRPAEESP